MDWGKWQRYYEMIIEEIVSVIQICYNSGLDQSSGCWQRECIFINFRTWLNVDDDHHREGEMENDYVLSISVIDNIGNREEKALIIMRVGVHIKFQMYVIHKDLNRHLYV